MLRLGCHCFQVNGGVGVLYDQHSEIGVDTCSLLLVKSAGDGDTCISFFGFFSLQKLSESAVFLIRTILSIDTGNLQFVLSVPIMQIFVVPC